MNTRPNATDFLRGNPEFCADAASDATSEALYVKWSPVLEKETLEVARSSFAAIRRHIRASVRQAEHPRTKLVDAQLKVHGERSETDDYVLSLEQQVATLKEQLVWAQRADSPTRTGGLATLALSDDHLGDRSHMPRCYAEMLDKSVKVLKQYQPVEITVLHNGDSVAGTGIYKNQNVDSVMQTGYDQIKIAAVAKFDFHRRLEAEFSNAKIRHLFTTGNHDRAMGEPLMPQLVLMLRNFGVPAVFKGDSAILNLAHSGSYYLLAEHGYGYSNISPSSPKYISDIKDKVISLQNRGYAGDRRIRRILHGHTHWYCIGIERMQGVFFDCTGGCQRNERVLLGKNQRPAGMIVYVSPDGFDGILDPIGVQPDVTTAQSELDDPFLLAQNMQSCSDAMRRYDQIAAEVGLHDFEEPEGR